MRLTLTLLIVVIVLSIPSTIITFSPTLMAYLCRRPYRKAIWQLNFLYQNDRQARSKLFWFVMISKDGIDLPIRFGMTKEPI